VRAGVPEPAAPRDAPRGRRARRARAAVERRPRSCRHSRRCPANRIAGRAGDRARRCPSARARRRRAPVRAAGRSLEHADRVAVRAASGVGEGARRGRRSELRQRARAAARRGARGACRRGAAGRVGRPSRRGWACGSPDGNALSMSARAFKWALFAVAICTVPLPYFMIETGRVPALQLFVFAAVTAPLVVSDPGFTTRFVASLFLSQSLGYGALLYLLAR